MSYDYIIDNYIQALELCEKYSRLEKMNLAGQYESISKKLLEKALNAK